MRIDEPNYLGDQNVYDDNGNLICTINPPNYLGDRPVQGSDGSFTGYYINESTSLNDVLRKMGYFSSNSTSSSSEGCYVATCVYGSYDCPEVWTLRLFRDNTLSKSWYGKAFISFYYAVSPCIVKHFGEMRWFNNLWKPILDKIVTKMQKQK